LCIAERSSALNKAGTAWMRCVHDRVPRRCIRARRGTPGSSANREGSAGPGVEVESCALDDVRYEIATLTAQGLCYLQVGNVIAHSHWSPAADALLESLLDRLRAFDEFFSNHKAPGNKDDVVAKDVAPGWKKRRTLRSHERKAINWRLSRFASKRPAEPTWQIGDMVHRALEASARFLKEPELQALSDVAGQVDDALANFDLLRALVSSHGWHSHP
jgi:hypothetical protein